MNNLLQRSARIFALVGVVFSGTMMSSEPNKNNGLRHYALPILAGTVMGAGVFATLNPWRISVAELREDYQQKQQNVSAVRRTQQNQLEEKEGCEQRINYAKQKLLKLDVVKEGFDARTVEEDAEKKTESIENKVKIATAAYYSQYYPHRWALENGCDGFVRMSGELFTSVLRDGCWVQPYRVKPSRDYRAWCLTEKVKRCSIFKEYVECALLKAAYDAALKEQDQNQDILSSARTIQSKQFQMALLDSKESLQKKLTSATAEYETVKKLLNAFQYTIFYEHKNCLGATAATVAVGSFGLAWAAQKLFKTDSAQ